MRWIGLAIIFVTFIAFFALLKSGDTRRRDLAVLGLGMLLFFTGPLQITASLIALPMWQGISKGIIFSLIDSLAIALLVTQRRRLVHRPFLILLALFTFPIVLSISFAPVKMATFFVIVQMVQIAVYYVALSGELQRPTAIRSLMKGLSLGLMIQAGYVISQKLSGVVQASGTMEHQNILGFMVELSALPLFAALLEGERNKLVYAGFLAGIIVIAGGGSRGTMLYFAVGLAIILLLSLARRSTTRKWKIVGLGLILAVGAIPLSVATLKDRFGDKSVVTEEEQRFAFERAARAMAADHWLGVGANNFVSVNNTQGYAARAGLTWGIATRSKPAHNAYLVARAETGWLGEITLILLIGGIATAGFRAGFQYRRAPHLGLAIGSAGAVSAIALHSNYEYAWYMLDIQRLFFMNAALITACVAFARQYEAQERKARLAAKGSALSDQGANGKFRQLGSIS